MICRKPIDWDVRMRFGKSPIVHAATHKYDGVYATPCGQHGRLYREDPTYPVYNTEMKKGTEVTCKLCLKVLGFVKKESPSILFTVVERESGMYFTGHGGNEHWSDNIRDAYLFKKKEGAVESMRETVYYDGEKVISYSEYNKLKDKWYQIYREFLRNGSTSKRITPRHRAAMEFDEKKYEVRPVKLVVLANNEYTNKG